MKGEQSLGLEAWVGVENAHESTQQQTSPDQQQQRQSDLRADQGVQRPMLFSSGTGPARGVAQVVAQLRLTRAQRGHDAERKAGDDRYAEREREDKRIDVDFVDARQAARGER